MLNARTALSVAIAAVLGLVSCETQERVRTTSRETRDSIRRAFEDAKAYGYDRKAEYERRLAAVAADFDAHFEELKAKAHAAGRDAMESWDRAKEELRPRQKAVRDAVTRAKDATQATWEEVRVAVNRSVAELEASFDRAAASL